MWMYWDIAAMTISLIATFCTTIYLYRKWDMSISCVRFIYFQFFVSLFCWCFFRCIYYYWLCTLSIHDLTTDPTGTLDQKQLEILGAHAAVQHGTLKEEGYITAIRILGDTSLFGVALWMFPMVYELGYIIKNAMDRGIKKEKQRIQLYFMIVYCVLVVFLVAEGIVALSVKGYTPTTRWFLFSVYFTQFLGLFYMVLQLLYLRVKGKTQESIHGSFMPSPIYSRLVRTMFVYAFFSFQYQLATIIESFHLYNAFAMVEYIALSSIVYHSTGAALSFVTTCSQACVVDACHCCLPADVEKELRRNIRNDPEGIAIAVTNDHEDDDSMSRPPFVNPVFVFTDIESSSALWSFGNGEIMQKATEIHDDLLRYLLQKHHGYEITTCGDAFQLAFHTIQDAVAYCLEVQQKLLIAEWPKELHGLVHATRKERVRYKLVFQGLRVRMGIHDTYEEDGNLVSYIHPVTKRMTFTGASEVIANEVGDLGAGGQILITKRIAQWLKSNRIIELTKQKKCNFDIEQMGEYQIVPLGLNVEVYQLNSMDLIGRKSKFPKVLDMITSTALEQSKEDSIQSSSPTSEECSRPPETSDTPSGGLYVPQRTPRIPRSPPRWRRRRSKEEDQERLHLEKSDRLSSRRTSSAQRIIRSNSIGARLTPTRRAVITAKYYQMVGNR